ncbi:MAG: YkgJ family cysteine cluster protein [Syntrophales bacterium]
MTDANAFAKWKQTILKDSPKLSLKDTFNFSCHKGLSCFTKCCADVNIFLTPYDILRMKRRLKISSEEFLKKFTTAITLDGRGFPTVILKMREDELKRCPFVSEEGCGIYEDRPWSCRMYPIGMASPDKNHSSEWEEFYFIVDQEFSCLGFDDGEKRTIEGWKKNQGVNDYELKGNSYKDITLHSFFLGGGRLTPEKTNMFYMACYDIDRFRRFILGSRFFNLFDIDERTMGNIKSNEEDLLEFGYRWIRFSLFQENTLKVKETVLEEKRKNLGL